MEVDRLEVLNKCKNYERIVNFEYLQEDLITAKLIKVYKEYFVSVLKSKDGLDVLVRLDYVLGRYIEDYEFRRELKKEIVQVKIKKSCTDILKAIVASIIKIFDNYLENSTRRIHIARWIWNLDL